MKQYLRTCVFCQQDNWIKLLSMCMFEANNAASEMVHFNLFFANYGSNPKMSVTVGQPAVDLEVVNAFQKMDTLRKIHNHVKSERHFAKYRQEEVANNQQTLASRFEVGEEV